MLKPLAAAKLALAGLEDQVHLERLGWRFASELRRRQRRTPGVLAGIQVASLEKLLSELLNAYIRESFRVDPQQAIPEPNRGCELAQLHEEFDRLLARKALARLSPFDREFVLLDALGLPPAEICALLGIPEEAFSATKLASYQAFQVAVVLVRQPN
ncbi:MAG: hypothetical protein U0002_01895 [Thermoanaerobaculia bacterium]